MAKKMYTLIGLIALSTLIIIALSWIGLSKLAALQDEGHMRAEDSVQTTEAAHAGYVLYNVIADSVINGNLAESAKQWQEIRAETDKQIEMVVHVADTDEEKRLAQLALQAYGNFVGIYEKEMLPQLRAVPRNAALISALDDKLDIQKAALAESLLKIEASIEKESKESDEEFDSVVHTTLAVLLAVGGIVLVGAVLVALGITRNVLNQLGGDPKDVANVVNTMAAGNFSMNPDQTPKAGSLLANAYQMQTALRVMIAGVREQAIMLEDMARSLAVAARQITDNVNSESDAVSSMASAIEEMSVSTSHISDQGGSARQIADSSRDNAEQGAQVVNKTVSGLLVTAQEIESASSQVSRLGEDASRISDVVQVIKEIADQTNLLALNAAIEAARAGEQGRGFAVVADEVRKLAERTGQATSEISEMSSRIGGMVTQALGGMDRVVQTTRQGVADAEAAQASITGIQQSFTKVASVIDDISSALSEQNTASNDLAKNTERVAQMAEENSSAAQGLLNLANELEKKAAQVRSSVEIFKV